MPPPQKKIIVQQKINHKNKNNINNTNDNFKQTNMHFEQAHDYKTFKHLNIIQKSFISIAF